MKNHTLSHKKFTNITHTIQINIYERIRRYVKRHYYILSALFSPEIGIKMNEWEEINGY